MATANAPNGLRGRRVVTSDGVRAAAIRWQLGRIVSVDAYESGGDCLDVGDLVLMPGLVDTHVHVNEPGRTEWEGFATATRAAAAGGVTTLVDMPLNSIPATTSVVAVAKKAARLNGQCYVDVGLWGGLIPGNARELPAMLEAGVLGFKAFMIDSGVPEFPWSDETALARGLEVLAASRAPLLAHAEIEGPIVAAAQHLVGSPSSYARFLAGRPEAAEAAAIEILVRLCERYRTPIHIVHHSAARALPLIEQARDAGLPLTAETCPHYLHFAAEKISDGATHFKCVPPVRAAENREQLWQALARGVIDCVVSDHSPCAPDLKRGSFAEAWGGIASLQLGLSVLWTQACKRGCDVPQLARWMCEAPARLAGLGARKGRLAPGHDADIVVWDPDATFVVRGAELEHRHKITPYEGETLRGRVCSTWLRGQRIFADGHHEGDPSGQWIKAA